MQFRYIAVEGPIGAGKTMLAERLGTRLDATLVLERPAVSPHREAIRATLSDALQIDTGQVSVKATRGEGMGFVGRGEGAAALAVATVLSGQDAPGSAS